MTAQNIRFIAAALLIVLSFFYLYSWLREFFFLRKNGWDFEALKLAIPKRETKTPDTGSPASRNTRFFVLLPTTYVILVLMSLLVIFVKGN
jgi:hypothetical protein